MERILREGHEIANHGVYDRSQPKLAAYLDHIAIFTSLGRRPA